MDQQGCFRPYRDGAKRRLGCDHAAEKDRHLGFEEGRHGRILLPLPPQHEGDAYDRAVAHVLAVSAAHDRINKSRANPRVDAAMAVLLLGVPTPNGYAARRTSFNATLSFAFRFLTR